MLQCPTTLTPLFYLCPICNLLEGERAVELKKNFSFICMYAAAGNLAARPLTLEIFPSWPMSHLQQPYSVSTGSVSSFTVAYSFLLTTSDKGVLG
jgi:hypothetical protein